MSRRVVRIGLVAAFAVVGVIAFRHYFSPGEVVNRKLVATIEAFEEERLLAVMSAVSRKYSDPWGLDYETLGGYLHETMETYDDLRVDYVLTRPEVREGEVRIDIEFILWGRYQGTKGYVIGSISDPCTATVLWREEAPGWRFASTPELDIPELREELESRRNRTR
jgi:hypothetical protein